MQWMDKSENTRSSSTVLAVWMGMAYSVMHHYIDRRPIAGYLDG